MCVYTVDLYWCYNAATPWDNPQWSGLFATRVHRQVPCSCYQRGPSWRRTMELLPPSSTPACSTTSKPWPTCSSSNQPSSPLVSLHTHECDWSIIWHRRVAGRLLMLGSVRVFMLWMARSCYGITNDEAVRSHCMHIVSLCSFSSALTPVLLLQHSPLSLTSARMASCLWKLPTMFRVCD